LLIYNFLGIFILKIVLYLYSFQRLDPLFLPSRTLCVSNF